MKHKFDLFCKKKKFFKNNELSYRIFFSVSRALKNKNNNIIPKKSYYNFLINQN
jgi:hypothetical protein